MRACMCLHILQQMCTLPNAFRHWARTGTSASLCAFFFGFAHARLFCLKVSSPSFTDGMAVSCLPLFVRPCLKCAKCSKVLVGGSFLEVSGPKGNSANRITESQARQATGRTLPHKNKTKQNKNKKCCWLHKPPRYVQELTPRPASPRCPLSHTHIPLPQAGHFGLAGGFQGILNRRNN